MSSPNGFLALRRGGRSTVDVGRAAMGGGQRNGEKVGSSKEATASNSQAMHSSSGAAAATGGSGSAAQRAAHARGPTAAKRRGRSGRGGSVCYISPLLTSLRPRSWTCPFGLEGD